MSDNRISVDDLSEAQIERVINSTGFQKMLAYHKLADGIEVLKEQDQLYESMVTSITKNHTNVTSSASVREFFELFIDEVESYTATLTAEEEEVVEDLEDLIVEDDTDTERED